MTFEPTNGLSQPEILFRVFRDLPTGTLVPYGDLPFDREKAQGLIDKVAKRMEVEQQRDLLNVRDQGYRIVVGTVQVELADRDRRRAVRRMKRGLTRVENADRREMSAREQERADNVHIHLERNVKQAKGSGRALGMDVIQRWRQERSDS